MNEETYTPRKSGWQCFHCGEHFKVWEQDQARAKAAGEPDKADLYLDKPVVLAPGVELP